ncbi:cellulase family glycosylhydrolase [Carboxylicivirga sp. N1Y90]|uniref:cellulase family glycosylhydrolase n=1 Tax=Carboxylicivirga fragile TaxID=3417571 RepID=UPI003D3527CB|nr:cellulase family glycosylhydrolase [Marinilabiliaceae bacterium N1Y90]
MNVSILLRQLLVITSLFLVVSCNVSDGNTTFPKKVTVKGDKFIDEHGRQVILNGINVGSKNKADNYLYKGGPELYKLLKEQGFNSIRFIIIWDGLEPEPGVYNEAYLEEIDQRIEWATANNLFVVLDMHQDLFSVNYSDGAPEWATITDGKKHTTGAIWSDAYMLSEAVQTAFDNFWNNTPAVDGIGIQDHYAKLWKHIAKRYANNPTVIGYDIMNEPFAGSTAQMAMPAMLKAYGELVYKTQGKIMSEFELLMTWADESNRTKALDLLSTEENYSYVIDTLYELNKEFETTHLQAMYQRVADAIREVDQNSILFLEHSYYSNMGVPCSIERVKLKNGQADPLVAYAPHGYDLVTDTKDAAGANSERVKFIYNRIKEKGEQLKMPVWLGEWGAYYSHGDAIVPVAQYAISLIEKHKFGQAYWSYGQGAENNGYFKGALLRPYPAYTNGKLLSYGYNHDTSVFEMAWEGSLKTKESTMVFIPDVNRLNKRELPMESKLELLEGTRHAWLHIKPIEMGVKRKLILKFLQ